MYIIINMYFKLTIPNTKVIVTPDRKNRNNHIPISEPCNKSHTVIIRIYSTDIISRTVIIRTDKYCTSLAYHWI